MSDWTGLGVSSDILRALGDQGFTTPTAIQSLAIPPAISYHRDIIGAAETVSIGLQQPLCTVCQSLSKATYWSISQLAKQPINLSVSYFVMIWSISYSQSISPSLFGQSVSQPINQPVNQSVSYHSVIHSASQKANQPTNQPVSKLTNQSVSKLTKQSINLSVINQPFTM